jgi:hypothetical protein
LKLLDLAFDRLGPHHIGTVENASIVLEGQSFTTQFMRSQDPWPDNGDPYDIDPPPAFLINCRVTLDYDFAIEDRPVSWGDHFVVMLLYHDVDLEISWETYGGLLLREVSDRVFERIGLFTCNTYVAPVLGEVRKYIASLPVRTVKII